MEIRKITDLEASILDRLKESDRTAILFIRKNKGGLLCINYKNAKEVLCDIMESIACNTELYSEMNNQFNSLIEKIDENKHLDENEIADIKIDEYLKHKHNGEDKEIHS